MVKDSLKSRQALNELRYGIVCKKGVKPEAPN